MSRQQPIISEDGRYYWDGTRWLPRPASMLVPAIIILVGSAIVLLGMLLPWMRGSAGFGVTFSVIGFQMDGIWLAGVSVLTAAFTGLSLLRDPSRFATVIVGLLVLVEIILLVWVGSEMSSALGLTQVDLYLQSVGPGIYVAGAGVLVSLVGSIVAAFKALERPSV